MMSNLDYQYFEIESEHNSSSKLSVCQISVDDETSLNRDGQIFFIPEIGVSYRSYLKFFAQLFISLNLKKIVTYDHFGSGASGGVRGLNPGGSSYLNDFKSVFTRGFNKEDNNVVVFGHGFGATLSLLAEGEGALKNIIGIVVENPLLNRTRNTSIFQKLGEILKSPKLNSYLYDEIYQGMDYFPSNEDRINFDSTCLNSSYFSVDFIKTYRSLTKNVIERAYLTEKPVLHLYSSNVKNVQNGELIELYQKGVGEKIVESYQLDKKGHFDNFIRPSKKNLDKINQWIQEIK